MDRLFDSTLYCLALINPISKVFILTILGEKESGAELRRTSIRASGIALVILLLFAFAGTFILREIFHVEVYSLRVAGGIVLFSVGFKALWKGVFFEVDDKNRFADLSIVPLASPMIAGPATITAAVSLAAEPDVGPAATAISLTLAVLVNLLVMLSAPWVGRALQRHNVMGALIRITGLIVATIAVQMILSGLGEWMRLAGR